MAILLFILYIIACMLFGVLSMMLVRGKLRLSKDDIQFGLTAGLVTSALMLAVFFFLP